MSNVKKKLKHTLFTSGCVSGWAFGLWTRQLCVQFLPLPLKSCVSCVVFFSKPQLFSPHSRDTCLIGLLVNLVLQYVKLLEQYLVRSFVLKLFLAFLHLDYSLQQPHWTLFILLIKKYHSPIIKILHIYFREFGKYRKVKEKHHNYTIHL